MKTIKVRIPCVVNSKGEWNATACHGVDPDECLSWALDGVAGASGERIYWINAELELPEETEVAGEVE